ncbi:MAG TPA: orotidine-5'-phosphate decarboxylase [Candidatus Limnocylindrales bacterium]|nr:orotidine-5'-phosphate decarboxylase [Candidatus Limnocylindrales bacterium]
MTASATPRERPAYLDRLADRSAATGTVLCLGLDPDPASLPPGFGADVGGIEAFARLVVEAALPYVSAVKPNLAFYEAYGSAGLAALERLRAAIPAEVPVVVDAKRGDIGSTAARQAVALFDGLGADAITVNPYLGGEAVAPLLERLDRFAYVLCRTSNPGAGELQSLVVATDEAPAPAGSASAPAEPLYLRVARRAVEWGRPGTVGLVVGATAPAELREVRRVAPGLAFLVPGVGAQGGEIEAALDHGPATAVLAAGRPGGGLLVNVGRGIAGGWNRPDRTRPGEPAADPGEAIAEAAREWARSLPVLP